MKLLPKVTVVATLVVTNRVMLLVAVNSVPEEIVELMEAQTFVTFVVAVHRKAGTVAEVL